MRGRDSNAIMYILRTLVSLLTFSPWGRNTAQAVTLRLSEGVSTEVPYALGDLIEVTDDVRAVMPTGRAAYANRLLAAAADAAAAAATDVDVVNVAVKSSNGSNTGRLAYPVNDADDVVVSGDVVAVAGGDDVTAGGDDAHISAENLHVNAVTVAQISRTVTSQRSLVQVLEVFDTSSPNISSEMWHNISCQNFEVPSTFIKSVLEPAICISGILGIVLTMVVLSRKHMCTSCNCYLTAMAIADLMFLLLLSAKILVDRLSDCSFNVSNERVIFVLYTIILMDTFQYLTVGVTVMLAAERYIAICHPMRAMTLCTVKQARVVIVVLTVMAFVLRSPKFFDIEISYTKIQSGEELLTVTWVQPYNEVLYTYIVTGAILTALPLLCLLVLNVRIIHEIRKSARYLHDYLGADLQVRSVVSSEELKITMMLVSVIIAFFVCHAPYMAYSFLIAISNFDTIANTALNKSTALQLFKHACHSLLALKSSCNFILYCWFSEKFWTTFKRIFCLSPCMPVRASRHRRTYSSNNNNSCSSNRRGRWQQNSTTVFTRSSCYAARETTC